MSLSKIYSRILEMESNSQAREAESMRMFSGDDKTFCFGEWREWRKACLEAGETLPPEDFKKQNKTGNGA